MNSAFQKWLDDLEVDTKGTFNGTVVITYKDSIPIKMGMYRHDLPEDKKRRKRKRHTTTDLYMAVEFLSDVRNVFYTRAGIPPDGATRIPSAVLVNDLNLQVKSAWRQKGSELNPQKLASILGRNFGIETKQLPLTKNEQLYFFGVIREKKVVTKGYDGTHFEAVFEQYLDLADALVVPVSRPGEEKA